LQQVLKEYYKITISDKLSTMAELLGSVYYFSRGHEAKSGHLNEPLFINTYF
jgi:hypothetical protein